MIFSLLLVGLFSDTLLGRTPIKNNTTTRIVQLIIKVQKTHLIHLDKILNERKTRPLVTLWLERGSREGNPQIAFLDSSTNDYNIYKTKFDGIIIDSSYKLTVNIIHGRRVKIFETNQSLKTFTHNASTDTVVMNEPRICKIDVHLLTQDLEAQFVAYYVPYSLTINNIDSSFLVADTSSTNRFNFFYWKNRRSNLILKRLTSENQDSQKPIKIDVRPGLNLTSDEPLIKSGNEYSPYDRISLLSSDCDD